MYTDNKIETLILIVHLCWYLRYDKSHLLVVMHSGPRFIRSLYHSEIFKIMIYHCNKKCHIRCLIRSLYLVLYHVDFMSKDNCTLDVIDHDDIIKVIIASEALIGEFHHEFPLA